MTNSKIVLQDVIQSISIPENRDEIRSIAFLLLESVFGVLRNDILMGRTIQAKDADLDKLKGYVRRVNTQEPVQYVLGEAYFYGRKFRVNPSVLIPRPETEDLIRAVLSCKDSLVKRGRGNARIVDIGTGSGCIAITLRKEWEGSQVFATDISPAALTVAAGNAEMHDAVITFLEHDVLALPLPFEDLDFVVSNPPYITLSEKASMKENVLAHEPHTALFVSDDDPLKFYRAIARQAKNILTKNGMVVLEINERYGDDVAALLTQAGFREVNILRDLADKPRVITAIRA